MSNDPNTANPPAQQDGETSKGAWIFLGVAAVIAAGSIGYNASKSISPGEVTVAQDRTPVPPAPQAGTGPRPSAEQIAAAQDMTIEEQREMIAGMVGRLEERLQTDTDDLNGWVMLMRSRLALGEPEKARAALEDAVAANPAFAPQLRAAAFELGIE